MSTHLEESLQRDIDRICDTVVEMAVRAEKALEDCSRALVDFNRTLAYAVILRDLFIDRKEEEIDRLCQEFIVTQQPVAGTLRFAYSTLRINLEIERVGDYAESIARHVLKLKTRPSDAVCNAIVEMARLSTSMFHNAVQAFAKKDVELARGSVEVQETVDRLRSQFNRELVDRLKDQSMPFEDFDPLMTIAKRFERVSDQARNICMEVQYMCTGQYVKHPGADRFRVLFVDKTGACLGQMAQAIGNACRHPRFSFNSAGLTLNPLDPDMVAFMRGKGIDLSDASSRVVEQIKNIEQYHVVVALDSAVSRSIPYLPRKAVFLDWHLDDPAAMDGSAAEKQAAYEAAFQFIQSNINEFLTVILGPGNGGEE